MIADGVMPLHVGMGTDDSRRLSHFVGAVEPKGADLVPIREMLCEHPSPTPAIFGDGTEPRPTAHLSAV